MKKTDKPYTIFVINPGSTSTKVALYHDTVERVSHTFSHSTKELQQFTAVADQSEFRGVLAENFLKEHLGNESLDAIAARGGLLRPIPSGVYAITETMLSDLRRAAYGEHASNCGALIASVLAEKYQCPAYIADPVVVDEMDELARISGIPEIQRKSIFHALNQKSAARKAVVQLGKQYEECNCIVAHLGGGISVGAHCKGKVIDVNNALNGDGPFSPERSGGVPAWQLVELALTQCRTPDYIKKRITGKGGIVAYCGTNSLKELSCRIAEGDRQAGLVFDAMAYQISKEIAMHGATLKGEIDCIVLTGGMTHNENLVAAIKQRIMFLAPVIVITGEKEMEALAENIHAVLQHHRNALEY